MSSPAFRAAHWNARNADHIAPINRLVDVLRQDSVSGWAPCVAPIE